MSRGWGEGERRETAQPVLSAWLEVGRLRLAREVGRARCGTSVGSRVFTRCRTSDHNRNMRSANTGIETKVAAGSLTYLAAGYLATLLIEVVPWLKDNLTADQQANLPIIIGWLLA